MPFKTHLTESQRLQIRAEIASLDQKRAIASKRLHRSEMYAKEDPDWERWVAEDRELVQYCQSHIDRLRGILENT